MAIPILSGSEVSTPSSGAPLDASSFRQAAMAKGRLGEAIGNTVGGLFSDVSQKIQEARNAKAVFDADHSLNATKNQFLEDLSKNPELAKDPGKWMPEYSTRIKATTDQIMSQPNLGPAAKRHLAMMTQNFTQHSSLEINTAALAREAADTKASGIMSAQDDVENDNKEAFTAKMEVMNEAGVMGPKETAARIAKFDENSAEFKANTAVATDPIHAPAYIKSLEGVINPKKLRSILHVAEEEQRRAQIANSQQIATSIDDDPLHTYDETRLKQQRDTNLITAFDYERLQNRMKVFAATEAREQAKTETELFNTTMLDARDNDWVTDTNPQKTAADLKAVGLGFKNPALRVRLNDKVDRLMEAAKRQGVKDEKPVHAEIFAQLKKDREDEALLVPLTTEEKPASGHLFWYKQGTPAFQHIEGGIKSLNDPKHPSYLSDDDIKEKFGAGMTREKLIAAERSQAATINQKMEAFFKGKPDATYQEADEYRKQVERPYVLTATKQSILKKIPVMVMDESDFKALPSGSKFIFNGREGVKH